MSSLKSIQLDQDLALANQPVVLVERLLKRECHDNQCFFFSAILCGENNGGHHDRSRKSMGEPRTADRMNDDRARSDRGQGSQAGRGNFSGCSWFLCLLPLIVEAAGLAVHRKQRSLLPEHFASYFVFDREKILFVKW